ncbi:hypothetical protein F2Q68_00011176 [Brassica cretica]|uniref:Uncharacterized protein n=1 Tax=Brassica cretica TaxID=69181 RepID=A0A8S9KV35_BRACR|nr:hypothetical protein F2Q68_00011176 [Brassica cretica]
MVNTIFKSVRDRKMDLPELPWRIYTLGEKLPALKSISYHTDDSKLLTAVRHALYVDEYEELKDSNLGVFIKCEITKEMASFWEMMGVDVDAGPTSEQIIVACGRCEDLSREYCMWLGYLAIFTGFIEGRKYSISTRASLARFSDGFRIIQVWVYYAMPELAANYGKPLPHRPSPPLLTSGINFIQKDFGEMFPEWDFHVEDPASENIIKIMFNANPKWKWTMNYWEVAGTNPWVNPVILVKEEDSGRPRKKARIKAPKETCSEDSTEARKEANAEDSAAVGGMTKEKIEQGFKDLTDSMGGWVWDVPQGDQASRRYDGSYGEEGFLTSSCTSKLQSESVNGENAGQQGKIGFLVNDSTETSSSKEKSLEIANVLEDKAPKPSGESSVLVLDKRVLLFQMNNWGKLEGRKERCCYDIRP